MKFDLGLFLIIFLFFYFLFLNFCFVSSASSDVSSVDFVSDVYFSSGDISGTSKILKGDPRNRVFYIPMDLVIDSDFFLSIDDATNFSTYNRLSVYSIGYSNSLPSLGDSVFDVDYISGQDNTSFYTVGVFDLTDLISSHYNSNYDYLFLSVSSNPRVSSYSLAYDHVSFYRESVVSTPTPTPLPSPSPGFSDEHIVVAGNGKLMAPETKYNIEFNFLPESVTVLDAPVGNYDMMAVYKVKIPLFVNMGDFDGRLWGSTQFFWDYVNYTLTSNPSNATVLYRTSSKWVESEASDLTFSTNGISSVQVIYFTDNYVSPQFYLCWDVSVYLSSGTYYSNALADQLLVYFDGFSFTSRFVKVSDSSMSGVLDEINQGIKDTNDTLDNQFQEEQNKGDEASSDASVMVDTLTTDIKSKWEILWYPITFTGNLLDVFVNGTSGASTYSARYANVVGYRYDSETGMLLPVISYSRDASSGTVITFPAYTLPVLDVQLWDSYTFDLSFLRQNFSDLFAVSDVIITVLEVFWLIAFLRDKYLEVFSK